MSTIRKFIAIVMLSVLLLVLFTAASANSSVNTNWTTITPNINPYEYGYSPEHLYVFLYHGYSPYFSVDIDTSMCTENRLYVYDTEQNTVTEISSQQVTYYTCTKDALFFVTSTQEIYKTDYAGQNIEFLYQCEQGNISDFNNYLDTLYFIEDSSRIIVLNYNTKAQQTVWTCSNLAWSFQLSPTELVVATVDEEHYLLDVATGVVSAIGYMTANGLITEAVTSASEVSESSVSLMAYFSPSSIVQENDVSLPLSEYPVRLGDSDIYHQYNYTKPITWFHYNKAEGCHLEGYESNCIEYTDTSECEGFARYAHDSYLHNVAPDGTEYETWFTTYPCSSRVNFTSTLVVTDFFSQLNTGDYVRYGQNGDSTPSNGVHSIVLVCKDEDGIWAYECNQNYTGLKDGETLNGQPKSYYGCGIHLQYYSYEEICARYQYVVYYIKHNYNESPVYDDATYHKVGCSHCIGYLRQKHTNVPATYISTSQHRATFNCCGGDTYTTSHTSKSMQIIDSTSHRVTFNCCGGTTATEPHTNIIYYDYSFTQHGVVTACCLGNILEEHNYVINSNLQRVCADCGREFVPGAELNKFGEEEMF